MRVIKNIPVSSIKVDRHSLSPQTFALAKFMSDGNPVPPIKVTNCRNGSYILTDGRHRITAAKLIGLSHIDAKFFE